MTIAHIAGMPFEDWIAPLAATAGGIAIALRAAWTRMRHRS